MAGRAPRLLDGMVGEDVSIERWVLKRSLRSGKAMATRVGGWRGVIDVGVRLG